METIKQIWGDKFKILFVLLIGFVIGLLFINYFSNINIKIIESTKAIASIILVVGVVYAARQFHLNQTNLKNTDRWNRRQLAMVESNKANDVISGLIEYLDEKIDYIENKETYKVKYLHDKFGNFTETGFDFNKEEEDGDDQKINGKELKNKIVKLLSTAEYIAAGVNAGILDEGIVKKLWKARLTYIFKKFKNYIQHLRIEHDWGTSVYSEMETLIKRWKKEEDRIDHQ